MSIEQKRVPTMEEFVKQKIASYHDDAVRSKVHWDASKGQKPPQAISAEIFWSWIQNVYAEIETLYRLIDGLMNSDRYAIRLSTATLGLPQQATSEEIQTRTKEFGELVSILIRRKQEWEAEEKQREKLK
jgi:hypothetical protein